MIFSIILIIIFIVVAFYVINVFLNIQGQVETGVFIEDLNYEIEQVWDSPGGSETTIR